VVFLAGLPDRVPGVTLNRFCGSSMQAIHDAAGRIALGSADVVVACGVESMSRVPMMGFNPMPHPGLADRRPETLVSMGVTAENLARRYGIARVDQEAAALRSHARAAAARDAGRFAPEIVAVPGADGPVAADTTIRADSSAEALAALAPSFDATGTVTAGTSSPLTDGASAVVVAAAEVAKAHGLQPLARIRATAVTGCAPEVMGIGPVGAARRALDLAGLTLADIDVIELNEAFAAQILAVERELGFDWERTNIDGGALALGHPLGSSGARITGKAASLLARTGGSLALATMCIGGGQGIATVLEATAS
jgi:acetyl-CoA acyltransferase